MSLINSEAFVGTRCRLYRRSDARIINAWVQFFQDTSIIVTTDDEFEGKTGEHYYIETFGPGVKACLDTTLVNSSEVDNSDDRSRTAVTLKVEGYAQISKSDEESRHLVDGMTVSVACGTLKHASNVRDISAEGIGIVSEISWQVGLPLDLTIHSPLGPIQSGGEVVYVKPHGARYRIGFKLMSLSRVDESRWRRLLGQTP